MKRKIITLFLLLFFSWTSVNAEERFVDVFYPADDGIFYVRGNVGDEKQISLRVLSLGDDDSWDEFIETGDIMLNISKDDIDNEEGFLDWIGVTKSNADGEYEFEYMTESETGWLLFTATTDNQKETVAYRYYSPEFTAEKIALLNEYIEKNEVEKINDFIEEYYEAFDLGNEYYEQMRNDDCHLQVIEILAENQKVKDKADLRNKIDVASVIASFDYLESKATDGNKSVEAMLESFENLKINESVMYSEVFKKIILDDVKNAVIESFKDISASTFDELKEEIEAKIMLGTVNNSAWGKIMSAFDEVCSFFGDDVEEKYEMLNATQKTKVAKEIEKNAVSSAYTHIDELSDDILTAINNSKINQQNSSSGGGGGSSSVGGGGTSVAITKPSYPTTNIKIGAETSKKTFDDLYKTEWAREAIESLAEKNIVSGRTEKEFVPDAPITREEFLAIIVRAFDIDVENAESDFDDVSEDKWYYKTVSAGFENGIISGIDEHNFGAGRNITREDMCVIAYRTAVKFGKTFENGDLKFVDAEEISDYAKSAVAAMNECGIVKGVGDNQFNPNGTATRASAAKVIYELLNYQEGEV